MKQNETTEQDIRDPLSDDELTVLEAGMEHMQDDRSKLPPHDSTRFSGLRRFVRNHKLLSILALLAAFALLAGIVIGSILLVRHLVAPTDTQLQKNDPITLIIGDRDPVVLDYDSVVINEVFYVDMMTIADYMKLTVSGTATRLCFEGAEGSTIQFEHGKSFAVINGFAVIMDTRRVNDEEKSPAPAYILDSKCFVPVSFLAEAVESGFSLKINSAANTLRIRRILSVIDGDKENAIETPILFTSDPFDEYIDPNEISADPRVPDYSIDVSSYEKYIQSARLDLVNKSHPLKSSYEPKNLTKLTRHTASGTYWLEKDAAYALSEMMEAMKADGVSDVYVTSAYRSYDTQQELYNDYVSAYMQDGMSRKDAEEKASTYSARAGQSEHQAGLAIDFTANSIGGLLETEFEKTDAFRWLSEHAWKYGFILRYPKSERKQAITGYAYEPWHFRFVGLDAAEEIDRRHLTLEEYIDEKQSKE